ncbi:helix-turn-helix domain-containing protein [Neptuniibacter sp.]|uniref:helix-turn-helix domain-containing protein n=1 Tax=Neptuniibacter sp. TaxID=1962643 RepID=UPI003B59B21E
MKKLFDSIKSSSRANEKKFARADLIMNITEDLLIEMESQRLTKSELATKLGKSKAYIGQTLSGERNMTLHTLADLCYELDLKPVVKLVSQKGAFHDVHWEEFKKAPIPVRTRSNTTAINDFRYTPEYVRIA